MDSLSPISLCSHSTVATPRGNPMDVELYHNQKAFVADVHSLHALYYTRMIFISGNGGSSLSLEQVLAEFPSAIKSLLVVDSVSADVVWVSSAVLVLGSASDAYQAYHKAQSTASVFSVQAFVKSETVSEIDPARFLHLDCTFDDLHGKPTGVCAVMSLAEAKRMMPADEEECRSRVLLIKRANVLGDGVSMKLKAYFDSILGDNSVEQVLMLPLKSRSLGNARPKPSKTGFVVFRNASDARMARAMGAEQMAMPNAHIKVETYDGL